MQNHITIRTAVEADAGALLSIYAPYVKNTAVSFEYAVPSEAEFTERIRTIQSKYPYLVAEYDGETAAYAYAAPFHPRAAYAWCVETTIYVKETMRGRGIGRVLYSRLESTLKEMGILNLNACIASPSIEDEYLTHASESFHRHMGYTKVAEMHSSGFKFQRWYNTIWMEKMLGAHTENPAPVKAFNGMIC
ncbi:MAG: N-acetyltransferase [Clostridiales bacterium]|nr:N-acetyltransferase [Clostridiales bacterium]